MRSEYDHITDKASTTKGARRKGICRLIIKKYSMRSLAMQKRRCHMINEITGSNDHYPFKLSGSMMMEQ